MPKANEVGDSGPALNPQAGKGYGLQDTAPPQEFSWRWNPMVSTVSPERGFAFRDSTSQPLYILPRRPSGHRLENQGRDSLEPVVFSGVHHIPQPSTDYRTRQDPEDRTGVIIDVPNDEKRMVGGSRLTKVTGSINDSTAIKHHGLSSHGLAQALQTGNKTAISGHRPLKFRIDNADIELSGNTIGNQGVPVSVQDQVRPVTFPRAREGQTQTAYGGRIREECSYSHGSGPVPKLGTAVCREGQKPTCQSTAHTKINSRFVLHIMHHALLFDFSVAPDRWSMALENQQISTRFWAVSDTHRARSEEAGFSPNFMSPSAKNR